MITLQKVTMSHSPVDESSQKRIPMLDGVRAIACFSVIIYHLHNFMGMWGYLHTVRSAGDMLIFSLIAITYANSGVILFFLLSGFLLFLPYSRALLFDSPWPRLTRFYIRRIFRIVPCYYLTIFLVALFFNPAFLRAIYWPYLWPFLTFTMSFPLSGSLDGPFWTLAIEFQFYLLLPIIAWIFALLVRSGTVHQRMCKLSFCLLALMTYGLLARYWGIFLANSPKVSTLKFWVYGDHGKYFEVFALGMFFSMIYTYLQDAPSAKDWQMRMRRLGPYLLAIGLLLLFLISLVNFFYGNTHDGRSKFSLSFLDPHLPILFFPSWLEWNPLGFAFAYGLCMFALLCGSPRLKRPLEWPVLRRLGSISFSLYLWHLPFFYLFTGYIMRNLQQQGWGPLVQYLAFWCWFIFVILPIAIFLYRWVEQPGIRLGERLLRRSKMTRACEHSSSSWESNLFFLII